MWVDTIYDLITNAPLLYIIHIRNGYICGTQNEIMKKLISAIKTVNAYELDLEIKRWIYVYKESVHSMHVWINFNASMHDMKVKNKRTETKRFQWLLRFHNLPMEKHCGFIILDYGLLWLHSYFYVFWLTVTSDLQ